MTGMSLDNPFNCDGRIRGSYVYLLLCRDDDGPIYVKTGISDSPLRRFSQLSNVCAVTPRRFMFVGVRSRVAAKKLERDLLDAFSKWKTKGEWAKLTTADKATFNKCWQDVFAAHAEKHWPLSWTQIPACNLIEATRRRRYLHFQKVRKRGKAYIDFERDSTVA